MKKKYRYLKVSRDEFELLEIIADNLIQLSEKVGTTPNLILPAISYFYKNVKATPYRRVEFDEQNDEG